MLWAAIELISFGPSGLDSLPSPTRTGSVMEFWAEGWQDGPEMK